MALISCPECNKEVSDKAEVCIHCGYPLRNTICIIRGEKYDLSFAFTTVNVVPEKGVITKTFEWPYPEDIIYLNSVITCPTCKSTNVSKIGAGERAASVGLFGIFSKKINKTFKCNSCGYTW